MSRIRTELENQVFYRCLTTPEWNALKGNHTNAQLRVCLVDAAAAERLRDNFCEA